MLQSFATYIATAENTFGTPIFPMPRLPHHHYNIANI